MKHTSILRNEFKRHLDAIQDVLFSLQELLNLCNFIHSRQRKTRSLLKGTGPIMINFNQTPTYMKRIIFFLRI